MDDFGRGNRVNLPPSLLDASRPVDLFAVHVKGGIEAVCGTVRRLAHHHRRTQWVLDFERGQLVVPSGGIAAVDATLI